ncbi:OB-fold protein [Variovorax sp. JS1663]|uniref:OB-fold protein n=1 Tax=Variovorax sp. JS1663 TaxID=1851577 RepID=UPI000B349A63|nr:hypothetical protein [Variovorax sp. JS1663]OUM04513.1 hypothetical protein A8M77_02185 [Variovorax sp. JS1663]
MTKHLLHLALTAMLLVGATAAPLASFAAPGQVLVSSAKGATPYQFDLQFMSLFEYLLADDISGFIRGDETLLGQRLDLVVTTPKEVAKIYADNQVAGDQKFFRKRLLLSGKIESISSGLGNTPYIVYRDTGPIGAQAHLSRDLAPAAAQLKKGQSVALVCNGKGSVAGVPMFGDCHFAASIAKEEGAKLGKEVERFLKGEATTPSAVRLTVSVEAMARAVDDKVDCSKGCSKAINQAQASDPKRIAEIIAKMRAAGLKIDAESEAKLVKAK